MDYQTSFPAGLINEQELTDLLNPIARVVGAKVTMQRVYIVSTDDGEVSGIFDTLADNLLRNRKKAKPEAAERKPRRKSKAPEGEKRLGLHSYRRMDTGEIFSKQKINKMLAANELARGTKFVNGHDETFMVDKVDETQDGPFQLIIVGE